MLFYDNYEYGVSTNHKKIIFHLIKNIVILLSKINNINGITAPSTTFWRVKDKAAPHNAVTSTEKRLNQAQKFGDRLT